MVSDVNKVGLDIRVASGVVNGLHAKHGTSKKCNRPNARQRRQRRAARFPVDDMAMSVVPPSDDVALSVPHGVAIDAASLQSGLVSRLMMLFSARCGFFDMSSVWLFFTILVYWIRPTSSSCRRASRRSKPGFSSFCGQNFGAQ